LKHVLRATLVAIALASPSYAATIGGYTDFIGFGDSLSDKGRAPGILLAPPSNDGRFTDGTTWMEQVGAAFENMGGANHNMALGGATAGPVNANAPFYIIGDATNGPRDPGDPDDIPLVNLGTFADQITAFFDAGFNSTLGSNPLVTVLMGGNDVLQAAGGGRLALPELIESVTDAVVAGVKSVYETDNQFDDFLLATLPNISLGPSGTGATPEELALAALAISELNLTLMTKAKALEDTLPVKVNFFQFDDSFADAIVAGVEEGKINSEACLPTLTPVNPLDGLDPTQNNCVFPGTSSAYLFAAIARARPSGFSLPLLAVALLGFGVLRRRQSALR